MTGLYAVVASVRFVLELCALVALAAGGWAVADGGAAGAMPAIAIVAAVAAVWGAFVAPKARHPLPEPARHAVGLAVFAAAAVALAIAGHGALAVAFAATCVLDTALFVLLEQRGATLGS